MNFRMDNTKNRFQTSARKVLCVCSAGLLRSPTAANVLHEKFGFNTRAVGHEAAFALIVMDDVLFEWADEVVCMSPEVFTAVSQKFGKSNKYVCLNVPDNYSWGDPKLKEIIVQQYEEFSGC